MNPLTMRAGELRRLYLGRGPKLLVDGLSCGSELCRGLTADEKPFDNWAIFFAYNRFAEVIHKLSLMYAVDIDKATSRSLSVTWGL
jgi:hypothetical protein